jgi:outer membrane lipoprotein-sorting protein
MKRFSIFILTIILSLSAVFSQKNVDAEKVIDKFINDADKNVLNCTFLLNVEGNENVEGNFILNGKKFYLTLGTMEVWYNGVTQWAYSADNNEVSIIEPTAEELAQINPLLIIKNLNKKFIVQTTQKTEKNLHFVCTPKDKTFDVTKVEITANNATKQITSLTLFSANGDITIDLKIYKTEKSIPETTFQFDKSKYKNVIINDLR